MLDLCKRDLWDDDRSATVASTLFCWANDQPEEAPSIEFLIARKAGQYGLTTDKEVTPKEASWNALLQAYGYAWTDEFDLEIVRSVKRGFFDPDKVQQHASAMNAQVLAIRADGSFEQAWRLFHDSFSNNKDEVLDALYASFMKNAKFISPGNLDGTVRLFKELGRPEQATEMLSHYMKERSENREFFNLKNDSFGDITDEEVKAAFNQKYDAAEEKRDIQAMLDELGDSWTDEDLATLAAVPISEYKRILTNTSGEELRRLLSAVFQFDRIANATAPMREISHQARAALVEIGAESDINRRRVKRYGIHFEEPGGLAEAQPSEPDATAPQPEIDQG